MKVSTAKENILKKVRHALNTPVPLPFSQNDGVSSIFHPATDDLEIVFAKEFTRLMGKFAFCDNETDCIKQIKELTATKDWSKIYCAEPKWNNEFSNTLNLENCDASVTTCESLVARTGTIVLSSAQAKGRTASVYAPIHICIAYVSQLVYDNKDALKFLKEKYAGNIPSMITFATGPSRTADIEKTLVVGVHGPKEVYLFLIDAPKK
jgi:L-lactate dehydrogenase complex protein LldG